MACITKVGRVAYLVVFLVAALWSPERIAVAQTSARVTTLKVPYIEYEWWLMSWSGNQFLCRVLVDHDGLPTLDEVASVCSPEIANAWAATPACINTIGCKGAYIHLIGSQAKDREVVIELPQPEIWVSLEGCTPQPPENRCPEIPTLVLTGIEPLPNERITAIQGALDGEPFYCLSDVCKIPLRSTPILGSSLEFWAESSYGDVSQVFTAQLRVIETGVTASPDLRGWYVDVISSQWQGAPLASCARIWDAFPPIGGSPNWLKTPEEPLLLASEEPYYYLAGRLIAQGLVDVSVCPNGGMLPTGYADACGLEQARPMLTEWQNQFDHRIVEVARETGVPAQLMKNLFAQESQFWPGVFRVPYEFGLGQLTDNGVDSIFLWQPDFFNQFCPLVLHEDACSGGYLSLKEENRAILRGALALQAKVDCQDDEVGIDLSNTNFSVSLFANTLQANCAQVSRTVFTATASNPGLVATYEDLWRFTIANYHAGPGCTAYAIHQTWQNTGRLTWEDALNFFTDPCRGVIPYVDKITK
jgi:hypothetical protein